MNTIPRPLVRFNQLFISISALAYIVTMNRAFLVLPIIFGIFSVLFNFNPLFIIGKKFLRKSLNEYIQEDRAQQRFNQILALSMFILAFVSSFMNLITISYIFSIMVFLASFIALLGFCIGCFIHYQYHMWKYRRSIIKA